MFQGDVLFFWQGSVLINVTSILHCGAFWSQVASPTKFCSSRDAALLHIVALLLLLPALYWATRPDSQFQFAAALSQVF